ncbi:hypothetical protein E2320_012633 [Naja naja]|nr:hypothetical protein E2320_012633 [Naja naja]
MDEFTGHPSNNFLLGEGRDTPFLFQKKNPEPIEDGADSWDGMLAKCNHLRFVLWISAWTKVKAHLLGCCCWASAGPEEFWSRETQR